MFIAKQPLSVELLENHALEGTFLIIGGMRYKEGKFRRKRSGREGEASRTINPLTGDRVDRDREIKEAKKRAAGKRKIDAERKLRAAAAEVERFGGQRGVKSRGSQHP